MVLLLCTATIAWYSKKSTFWSHDLETFQPKIGQCDFYSEIVPLLSRYVTFHQIPSSPTKDYICTLLLHTLLYVSTWVVFEFETLALEFWCHLAAKLKKWKPDLHFRALCPIHVVTCTLISNLVTDYIQKRRGEPGLFSFEFNLLPKLISK